ncbi:MAG: hypothetical protein KME45_03145 [Stenomitos rutilans HA7619-LM2]|jgi:hypothetical protein|nr:hypothetical protein [Stenomitos rutilans HA7619-LM2]MBW4469381.1 hypothetical protein [Stenomitos rutilans HA7619-LM2]
MALFTAECCGYQTALDLIELLTQVGIEANITAGGVAVHAAPDQVQQAKTICQTLKCSFDPGYSSHQERILLRTTDGWRKVGQVTGNAISVIQEWENPQS